MKSFVLAAVAAAAFVSPALADKIDMGAATCKEYTSLASADLGTYLTWLDGYMSAKSGDTVMDTDAMTALGTKLMEACKASPDEKILPAIDAAMAK